MNTETFGKIIKKKRLELGLTQKGLADKLFITDKAVSKWERGISFPDLEKIEQISEILNIPLLELLGETDNKANNLPTYKAGTKMDDSLIQMVKDNVEVNYLKAKKRTRLRNKRQLVLCIIATILIGLTAVIQFPLSYDSKYEKDVPIVISLTKKENINLKIYAYELTPGTPEYVAFMNMNSHYHMHLSLCNLLPFFKDINSSSSEDIMSISIVQGNYDSYGQIASKIFTVLPPNGYTTILDIADKGEFNTLIVDMGHFTFGDEKDYVGELTTLLDTLEPTSVN